MKRTPTVGIVIINHGKVLLVEHGIAAGHLTGALGAPGGRLDPEESTLDAAVREVEEETGLIINKDNLVKIPHIYEADLPRKNGEMLYVSHTVFATTQYEGEIRGTDETTPRWIKMDRLKDYNLLINTEDMVSRALEVLRR